ncbi:MAG: SRPBCC family protein [Dehalococcoidia bacterium]
MANEAQGIDHAEIRIDASPEQVYDLVSDIPRTGEWSPECARCEWVDGATGAAVGARFRGQNRFNWLRWSRLNEVIVADRGKEFAFKTLPGALTRVSSIWRYQIEADGEGCRVRESEEMLGTPGFPVSLFTSLAGRNSDMTENISQSLERIKAIVEGARTS